MRSHRVPSHPLCRSVFAAIVIPTLAIPAVFIGALTGPPAASAGSTVRYVALGDSYSSGVGAGSYDRSSGKCERSANAYPQQWAARNAPASFVSAACSGATTSAVLNSQISVVTSRTTLVSITIGGNDAGFSRIMKSCVLESDSACLSAISNAENFVTAWLPARLDMTLHAIHSHAPSARIVVLDYPELYDLSKSRTCFGMSSNKRAAIDHGAARLDSVISAAAARNGDIFSDVRSHFSGHEICDSNGWLHSMTWPNDASYHPTASGQELGYEPAFSAAAG
ncbi:MAG TPA: SGNH/GDSL hydrolase family protein [Streptosporangiaceae bacterium]|nr:SGNH/GDSL hydrolase family protein [Streptosporangiaceae bacterium]